MPIPILLFFGFCGGAMMALVSDRPLRAVPSVLHTRYFLASLCFSALILISGLSTYAGFPDWSLMYLADSAHLPWAFIYPSLAIMYVLAPPAGFVAGHRVLHTAFPWLPRMVWIGLSMAALFLAVSSWHRASIVAYYDAFHHNLPTVPLSKSPLLLVVVAHVLSLTGALLFTLRALLRHAGLVEAPSSEPLISQVSVGGGASTRAQPEARPDGSS